MSREEFIMETISPVLKKCVTFRDIPQERYKDVLSCLNARFVHYEKEEMIRKPGDDKLAGIVIRGTAKLILQSESGGQMSIAYYTVGEMFNKDTACTGRTENFSQVWALTDCSILFLDLSVLFAEEKITCRFKKRVAVNLLRDLAEHSMQLNDKLRILAQKRLRDRIKVYLQMLPVSDNSEIIIPFNRNELAEYLCVDRSALSRELGRMQDENIIRLTDKGVCISDRDFLI
ncbi:MAG: Crp/Fnr family transcriptional regulator [Clostridium sp.]|nr:Crp/Fnr family transcriptional regulator [Clostridium sp.]